MGLFDRRPKATIEEVCRGAYPRLLPGGFDEAPVTRVFFNIALRDEKLAKVPFEKFLLEIIALQLELFGLAWVHKCKFLSKYASAPFQSDFTRRYLHEKGAGQLWEGMEPYNHAVGRSGFLRKTGATPAGRAHLTLVDSFRYETAKEWANLGLDNRAVGRAINRLSVDVAWKDCITHEFLASALVAQLNLGIVESESAWAPLFPEIQRYYDESAAVIGAYNIRD